MSAPRKHLRPPLDVEIESDSDNSSKSDMAVNKIVAGIPPPNEDFIVRLWDEDCTHCRPPASYFDDGQTGMPISLHHLPWDEVEMRMHDLLSKQCHHVEARPPLDEVSKLHKDQCHQRFESTDEGAAINHSGKRKPTFRFGDNSLDDSDDEEDEDDDIKLWETIEEAPFCRYFIEQQDPSDGKVTVKDLADGGRLIMVQSEAGCEMRILENAYGERLLVTTRCCAEHSSDEQAPTELPVPLLDPIREKETVSEERVNSDTGVGTSMGTSAAANGSKAPSFSLMSRLARMRQTDADTPPPTWNSDDRAPLPFESVVEDSEGAGAVVAREKAAAVASSVETASTVLKKSVKSETKRTGKSAQKTERRIGKANVTVALNVKLGVASKKRE